MDELHHFSASEVSRITADLKAETASTNEANGVSQFGTHALSVVDSDFGRRIAGIEKRLAHQEEFVRRVASAVDKFLHFRHAESG